MISLNKYLYEVKSLYPVVANRFCYTVTLAIN